MLTYHSDIEKQQVQHPVFFSGSAPPPPLGKMHGPETYCNTPVEAIAEASNDDVIGLPKIDSSIYNPNFASSQTSITSYKTERTINSRKSRYDALPRRKYADVEHLRLPRGLVLSGFDSVSVSKVRRTTG